MIESILLITWLRTPQPTPLTNDFSPQHNIIKNGGEESTPVKETVAEYREYTWLTYRELQYGFSFSYPNIETPTVSKENKDGAIYSVGFNLPPNEAIDNIKISVFDKTQYLSEKEKRFPIIAEEVRKFLADPLQYENREIDSRLIETQTDGPSPRYYYSFTKLEIASLPALQTSFASTGGFSCEIIFEKNNYIFSIKQGYETSCTTEAYPIFEKAYSSIRFE